MTASYQNPVMGAAFHALYGGSEKHDAVPELFEDGWKAGRNTARNGGDRAASAEQIADEALARLPLDGIDDYSMDKLSVSDIRTALREVAHRVWLASEERER